MNENMGLCLYIIQASWLGLTKFTFTELDKKISFEFMFA